MIVSMFMQILDMTKTASIVILVVLLIRLLLKRMPKVISYALWAVVLFRLLCPLSIEVPVSIMPEITPTEETYTLADVPITPTSAALAAYRAVGDALNGGLGIQYIYTELPPEDGSIVSVVTSTWWEVWILFGQYIWLAGVAVMAIYAVVSTIRLKRNLTTASPVRDNIWLSDEISTPFVMGIIRPKIYLPSSLHEREQSYIILHEQHHIRRLDHIIKAVSFVALSIHWFNPLVWAAFILSGRDMEMSCDEAVVRKMGNGVLADYSASLLSLATGKQIVAGMPLAFGEGDTGSRIRNLARKFAHWKKPALWVILPAVVLCAVLAICLITSPSSDGTEHLPPEGSFHVVEVTYESGIYSFTVVAGQNSPSYKIGTGMMLSSRGEYGEANEWVMLGQMEEFELTKDNFDERFPERDGSFRWTEKSASFIRRNNEKAWMLIYNEEILYYLLQQKNGEVYLAYGYYDFSEKDDPYSDDTTVRWLFRLAKEEHTVYTPAPVTDVTELIPGTTYVSYQGIYMNPLSSFAAIGGDSGCRYTVHEDSFETYHRIYRTQNVNEVTDWTWKPFPYSEEEWLELYQPAGFNALNVHELFDNLEYLPLNAGKFLMRADGAIWLVKLSSNPQMGTYLWSIFSLVPENAMGVAQWENIPQFSSRSPVFPFQFDMEYTEISAVCEGGELMEFGYGDRKSASSLTIEAGNPLCWLPSAPADQATIRFTVHNGEKLPYSGTLYIEASDDPKNGRTVYTASLVGTGLHLSQNTEGEGGIISLVEDMSVNIAKE